MIKEPKATGHDRISPKILKDSADVIAHSLTNVFNKPIETGIFPDDFKLACIFPIIKNGSKSDRNNYRPISVLSVVAKVFEELISKQWSTYLESNTEVAVEIAVRV